MKKYLLGVDNGGTSIKSAIFDEDGRQLFVEKQLSLANNDGTGRSERDQEQLWKNNYSCIRSLIMKSGISSKEIAGVAFAGQGKGLYAVDKNGEDIFPAITSADIRAEQVVGVLRNHGVNQLLYPRLCQEIHSYQPLAILRWMKENRPSDYERISHVFAMKDYLNYQMTGNVASDYSSQSGSPFINFKTMEYDKMAFEAVGVLEKWDALPPLKWPGEVCGYVTPKSHLLTHLEIGTPVAEGMFDVNACALAMGVLSDDIVFMITGTWSINAFIGKEPVLDGSIMFNSIYFLPGFYQIEEGSPTSAGVLEWAIPILYPDKIERKELFEKINKDVSSVDPSSSDVVFLPFVHGAPDSDAICGAWIGLNNSTRREEMIAALYEGVAFGHRYHVERLKRNYHKPMKYRLAGGVANSDVWCQIFANVINEPLEIMANKELGAQGAAICAGVAAGLYDNYANAVSRCVRVDRVIKPVKKFTDIYEAKYQKYLHYMRDILIQ